ncbi:hypothetical protein BT96DRAFT_960771 [Gymnopus androsaceus JB14]|uniref:Endonuclease/exonuclease/phosphatase domain-containing protein n=1 Tax=Gymnopus androsaceus JB14 TaxID=1447944 RepID=A0A6A4GIZ0_9AGAR|nr:hypothetical protein BT96DRAFT_960771 [Gymnopus androsaceus JB14]
MTRKLVFFALQETHLTEDRVDLINRHYGHKIHVFGTHDPTNPTGRGGVAIVLNKELVAPERTTVYEIVPGRAIMLQVTVHKGDKLNILAVYAPNVTDSDGSANAEFWQKINKYFEDHPRIAKPDIMLGDCNMVEQSIDRLPSHGDPDDANNALDNLKRSTQLKDGWRTTFPDKLSFTFSQVATGSQSRIDRIYATESILETAKEWKICTSGMITTENAPMTDKGRWRIPEYVVKDKDLLEYARQQGITAKKELEETLINPQSHSPQKIWYEFKMKLVQKARERARQIIPGYIRKINEKQLELDRVLDDVLGPEAERAKQAAKLQAEISQLVQSHYRHRQQDRKNKA